MQLLIFDMGGVMVDGFDVAPAMALELGLEHDELALAMEASGAADLHAGLIDVEAFWERFTADTGVRPTRELWGALFNPTRRPEMYELVGQLRAAGHRVVAGTNTIAPHYLVHSERDDYGVFDRVYASHLLKAAKPDARFWELILEAEGVKPEEALFVDDVPDYVAAAAALGINAVSYDDFRTVKAAVKGALQASYGP